jgi:hypothetical protein
MALGVYFFTIKFGFFTSRWKQDQGSCQKLESLQLYMFPTDGIRVETSMKSKKLKQSSPATRHGGAWGRKEV